MKNMLDALATYGRAMWKVQALELLMRVALGEHKQGALFKTAPQAAFRATQRYGRACFPSE